jgi:Reverse transcriptase (RNA-dependent DNA polymerase)/Retroviral aspartyl protease
LWDSGATRNFISGAFVRQHGLQVHQQGLLVKMADGSEVTSPGYVQVKLRIQRYNHSVLFWVMDLAPGFDVVLGTPWSKTHGVRADYGWQEGPVPRRAHLQLRNPAICLWPSTNTALSNSGDTLQQGDFLSAAQAVKQLASGQLQRPAFTVMIRERSEETGDNEAPRQQQIDELVQEFKDVFEAPTSGAEGHAPECIRMQPDACPPNRASFRLSLSEKQEIEVKVHEMLEKGWIAPSGSAYGAPVLFVPKPDGTLRMCIDYRALNKLTQKNKYPLPRIDDLLDNLSGAKYFSSLDLTSGYHQMVLHPADREKTAFNTHIGKYEWRVLPMGLCNAPAVFQAEMNRIFQHQLNRFVCVYLDDILIFSRTEAEHIEHLRTVLEVLWRHGYKAKPSKCVLQVGTEVSWTFGANGIRPDPAKVKAVQEWPVP